MMKRVLGLLGWLGVALVFAAVAVRSFSGRQARFGTLAVASALLVLAILAAINYLASRHNKRWDLTAAHQFTLADQTRKVLQGLDRPMRVIVFARSEDRGRFKERLAEDANQAKHLAGGGTGPPA